MEDSKELISVIVPIFNKEKYLDKCIRSILNQSYVNLELILINDGSTDRSHEICERFSTIDKKIKLVNTENRGSSKARNTAIDMANGKYIAFVDADDYIHSEYLSHMHNMLKEHDADIAKCKYKRIEETDNYNFEQEEEEQISKLSNVDTLIQLYGKDEETHDQTVVMCNKLFKKELFENIRYVEDRVIDDETIIYKLIYKTKNFVETNKVMYAYVQSYNSLMRQDFSRKRLDDSLTVYDECTKFFAYENKPEVQAQCLKRNLLYCVNFIDRTMNSSMENKKDAIEFIKNSFSEKSEILENLIEQKEHLEEMKPEYLSIKNEFHETLNKYIPIY